MAGARDESALVIPALDLIPLVEEFRRRYDPSSRAGVPPHITLLGPFLDPELLTDRLFRTLDQLLAATEAFGYSLAAVRQFPSGVLYLAPEPSEPFSSLIRLLSRHFDVEPYGGAFQEIVPHLTVAQTATEAERGAIASVLHRSLPIFLKASEAWLMVGHTERTWTTIRSIVFRG